MMERRCCMERTQEIFSFSPEIESQNSLLKERGKEDEEEIKEEKRFSSEMVKKLIKGR